MDGTARYPDLLAKLGKHTITGYCLYIKHLSDIELPVESSSSLMSLLRPRPNMGR
jgi:hypothetical protein